MAFDGEQIWMLVGFIIVIVVGVNIVFVFGGMTQLSLTGAVVGNAEGTVCKTTTDGILCDQTLYPKTPSTGVCPLDSVPVYTNACQLDLIVYGVTRECPSAGTSICLPKELAKKL